MSRSIAEIAFEAGRICERYEHPSVRPLSTENFLAYDMARRDQSKAMQREREMLAAIREARDDLAAKLLNVEPHSNYTPWRELKAELEEKMARFNKALGGEGMTHIEYLLRKRDRKRDGLAHEAADMIESLREKAERYEAAALYPGDGERHRGVTVATQLVHAQMKREEAEAQVAALRELLLEMRQHQGAIQPYISRIDALLQREWSVHPHVNRLGPLNVILTGTLSDAPPVDPAPHSEA